MDVTAKHTFEYPIEKVWAMFADQDSHVAKFEGMGHRDIKVLEFENSGSDVLIKVSRVVDVDLPGYAKKVLKPTSTVESTDKWHDNGDGTYGGTFSADPQGQPVDVKGKTTLTPDGDGKTLYQVDATVKVKVPLIGGKIENWAKGDILKQMEDEFAAGETWLSSH